jgi:hypothetical protein
MDMCAVGDGTDVRYSCTRSTGVQLDTDYCTLDRHSLLSCNGTRYISTFTQDNVLSTVQGTVPFFNGILDQSRWPTVSSPGTGSITRDYYLTVLVLKYTIRRICKSCSTVLVVYTVTLSCTHEP